jgi:hypothetical protein
MALPFLAAFLTFLPHLPQFLERALGFSLIAPGFHALLPELKLRTTIVAVPGAYPPLRRCRRVLGGF